MSGYGDDVALWQSRDPIESAIVIADGVVVTDDTAGVVRDLPRKPPSAIFTRNTPLTEPDEAIEALAKQTELEDALENGFTPFRRWSRIRSNTKPRPPAARRLQPRLWLWEPACVRTTLIF